MTLEKHGLLHDFPQLREKIYALKTSNPHFARLYDEYDTVEHEVRRIEAEVETPSDEYVEAVKLRRVKLKDQLYAMLNS